MAKIISIFNNKGGVGKTTIAWNLADALARKGKKVLMIDFDPQCNLSIAILGSDEFKQSLPTVTQPYGTTIRAYLQKFLQGIGNLEIYTYKGKHTHTNVDLIAGDFWLNVYGESLSVGSDLLTGTGITKYAVIKDMVEYTMTKKKIIYDFAIIDLPPSFGALVRAALYSSDYFLVPCTSDTYSSYCISLIGEMIPTFIDDWKSGYERFSKSNPNIKKYQNIGDPKFAGWIYNGFDTQKNHIVKADYIHYQEITKSITQELINNDNISKSTILPPDYKAGEIEDMNVLIQNSIWQSIPVASLKDYRPMKTLQDKGSWAPRQLTLIDKLDTRFMELADNVIASCI